MPRFGGLNMGNIAGALGRNALGSIANAVLPRSAFGGFGVGSGTSLLGQNGILQSNQDRRASLRPRDAAVSRVLGNGLLNPLKETSGMIWPYTPSINYSHPIDYQPMQTVHTNQDFLVYARTAAVNLMVDGVFSVQNQKEGQYAMAVIHFLRTMAKMHFGDSDPLAGTPPPVLLFNAYGAFVFKDVPVVVKNFSINFPDDVDYVEVKTVGDVVTSGGAAAIPARPEIVLQEAAPASNDGPGSPAIARRVQPARAAIDAVPAVRSAQTYTVWLPSQFKVSVELTVQHTPKTLRSRFNLPAYINGANNQKDFV